MEKFAFIIHPLSIHDMAHVSPVLKFIPDSWLESALKLKKPFQVSHITGIKSPYAEAEGWFIGCPLTSKPDHLIIAVAYLYLPGYIAKFSAFMRLWTIRR